jgi:hypothetical protein
LRNLAATNGIAYMLLILTKAITNRLRYIADLMVGELLGIGISFTTSTEEFIAWEGPKMSYGLNPVSDELFLESSELQFENTVSFHDLTISLHNGVPVIFASTHPRAALPFDPLAAAFYMVSRYEEYLPFKKDSFGRFPATESVAWKGKFLEIPVVHLWAAKIEELLRSHFPGLKFRHTAYRFVPTIDVDHAWCFLGRSLSRTLGGFGRSLIHGRFREITDRALVLAGSAADPYDNYAFIRSTHELYHDFPLYFILFANYGMNDNNVTVTSKNFHRLLRELDWHRNVGIHPSLTSGKQQIKLHEEYKGLSGVIDRDVTISRQHFLKFSMPDTFRNLIQLGISDDYSMGYASHIGFRAGIAIPFPFFDLGRNEVTSLTIHPVSIMDVTLKDYLRLNTVESLERITYMLHTLKSVHGEFVSLWHNESLGDSGRWKGWREVYKEMVKMASV